MKGFGHQMKSDSYVCISKVGKVYSILNPVYAASVYWYVHILLPERKVDDAGKINHHVIQVPAYTA